MKFKYLTVIFISCFIISWCFNHNWDTKISKTESLRESCVLIKTVNSIGSGVIFTNGQYSMVWTNHHVIQSAVHTLMEIDLTTNTVVDKTVFDDVQVCCPTLDAEGVKTSFHVYFGKIIRTSPEEDLALILLYDKPFCNGVTFADEASKVKDAVGHFGSFGGAENDNFYFQGIISGLSKMKDGLEPDNLAAGRMTYDVVDITFYKGCSGGGVFNLASNECVGLMCMACNEHFNCAAIIPAKRIWAFAKKHNCEWAVNHLVAVKPCELKPKFCDTIKVAKP